jgi:hypothetical protein
MKSLMFGVCLILVCSAKGATILNDSFDYTNGPLVIVGAGLWATHSGVTGRVKVVSEASPSYISPGFVRDDDVLILSICFKPCVHQHHEPGK